MKIPFFLLFLFLSFYNSHGQTIGKLDEKKGFKDFKLGDPINKWESSLKFEDSNSKNERIYEYLGSCCKDVFDYPVSKIELAFHDSSMVFIGIDLKPYQDTRSTGMPTKFDYPSIKYNKLISDFTYLFGKYQYQTMPNENGKMVSTIWESNNVVLIADYYFTGDQEYVRIIVMDKNYYGKKKQSGF